ncbi:hypothetical protein B0H10DRAFT_1950094 [Mycena sp. CBHHK59/15]|nr:hypothetical protein B0H10DRAFT_1950094 [Mycena sp. CBHHK59/15]
MWSSQAPGHSRLSWYSRGQSKPAYFGGRVVERVATRPRDGPLEEPSRTTRFPTPQQPKNLASQAVTKLSSRYTMTDPEVHSPSTTPKPPTAPRKSQTTRSSPATAADVKKLQQYGIAGHQSDPVFLLAQLKKHVVFRIDKKLATSIAPLEDAFNIITDVLTQSRRTIRCHFPFAVHQSPRLSPHLSCSF